MWRNVGPICFEKKSMLRQNHTPYFAQLMLIMYLVLFDLNLIGNAIASAKCRQAEYRVGGECCPTCPPGKRPLSELDGANGLNQVIIVLNAAHRISE